MNKSELSKLGKNEKGFKLNRTLETFWSNKTPGKSPFYDFLVARHGRIKENPDGTPLYDFLTAELQQFQEMEEIHNGCR